MFFFFKSHFKLLKYLWSWIIHLCEITPVSSFIKISSHFTFFMAKGTYCRVDFYTLFFPFILYLNPQTIRFLKIVSYSFLTSISTNTSCCMIISYIELNQCFFHLTVSHTPNLSEIDVYEEVKGMLFYFVHYFRNDWVLILNPSLKFEMGTKEREEVIL